MLDKRIGLLVLSIGNFGNKEFYNLQEVGLAKALSKFFKEILIYKLVERSEQETTEIIDGYRILLYIYYHQRRLAVMVYLM